MVAFDGAALSPTQTDGGHTRRALAHAGDLLAAAAVDAGHTRRLFAHGGDVAAAAAVDAGHTRRLFTHGLDVPATPVSEGIIIPTGNFSQVHVTLYDTAGERLTEALWVMSSTIFPTAAAVDANAEADLWLLTVTYDTFMAIAEYPEDPNVDYTWYSTIEGTDPVNPAVQTEADITLEPTEIEAAVAGLLAAAGVKLG